MLSHTWWYVLLILVLKRQRQTDLHSGQPGLHREFLESQGYITERLPSQNNRNKKPKFSFSFQLTA